MTGHLQVHGSSEDGRDQARKTLKTDLSNRYGSRMSEWGCGRKMASVASTPLCRQWLRSVRLMRAMEVLDHGRVAVVGGGAGGSINLHFFSLFRNGLFNFSFKSRHC